jgi:LuxR family transcriptional regulator, maltose regulon positive regulatory protein
MCRRGIELDSHAETLHCGLMQALMKLGRLSEAIEAFRHCRALLRAGLGREPSAETRELYTRLI